MDCIMNMMPGDSLGRGAMKETKQENGEHTR